MAEMEWTVFPTELVLFTGEGDDVRLQLPSREIAFRLNEVSRAIAEAVQSPVLFSAIERKLMREFDVDARTCTEAVEATLEQFRSLGIVAVIEDADAPLRRRYIDLLKRAVANFIYPENELRIEMLEERRHGEGGDWLAYERRMRDIRYLEPETFEALLQFKREGGNWKQRPARFSHTMIGQRRLDNLDYCAAEVMRDGIEGDFLEAGVLQGGASIFLRGLQVAYGEPHRRMWVADSFAGLPPARLEQDVAIGIDFTEPKQPWLAWPLHAVRDNFRTYDLLSDEVRFVEGWFSETLPHAPIEKLAILRLDADLYESTRDVLVPLYDKVVPGGFIIVDDYHAFAACRQAVDEVRLDRRDDAPLRRIDWSGVCWKKR
jgi:hypothetical protein